jgi:hypothetical protein
MSRLTETETCAASAPPAVPRIGVRGGGPAAVELPKGRGNDGAAIRRGRGLATAARNA